MHQESHHQCCSGSVGSGNAWSLPTSGPMSMLCVTKNGLSHPLKLEHDRCGSQETSATTNLPRGGDATFHPTSTAFGEQGGEARTGELQNPAQPHFGTEEKIKAELMGLTPKAVATNGIASPCFATCCLVLWLRVWHSMKPHSRS